MSSLRDHNYKWVGWKSGEVGSVFSCEFALGKSLGITKRVLDTLCVCLHVGLVKGEEGVWVGTRLRSRIWVNVSVTHCPFFPRPPFFHYFHAPSLPFRNRSGLWAVWHFTLATERHWSLILPYFYSPLGCFSLESSSLFIFVVVHTAFVVTLSRPSRPTD